MDRVKFGVKELGTDWRGGAVVWSGDRGVVRK